MANRHSEIRRVPSPQTQSGEMFVVDLWEDGKLVQTRELPEHNYYYAQDLSENWDTGVIQQLNG
jgi:hypothetical protein